MDSTNVRLTGARRELVQRLFPGGIPMLWCPPVTHFAADGSIDAARTRAHLRFMHRFVRGFLVPGSTGEGWDMSDDEVLRLLDLLIEEARDLPMHLLVGVLKTDVRDAVRAMEDTVAWLERATGASGLESLTRASVCGFTACPPSGSGLGQDRIRRDLEQLLSLGLPISLYQIPQITQNEMSPETVAELSARYPNFFLFKDTSGADRVAASGFRGAFLVRGAEADYARHHAAAGGGYDGFLLATANCFGRELCAMIEDLERGRRERAEAFSSELTALWAEVFEAARAVAYGNPFANTAKAIEHFFAHGPAPRSVPPPYVHSGTPVPSSLIEAAREALLRHGLMPRAGYLEVRDGA